TELLLANKADVNATNNDGATPLMIAIEQKNEAAIELLQGLRHDSSAKVTKAGAGTNLPVRLLGSLTNRFKIENKYVLIEKGSSEAELIKLAKELHRLEPKTSFWMLDDDARAE